MSIKTAIAKYGLGKIIDQLYEDPQKGMLTAIGWADKFSRGEFVQQRATVRKIIENEDDPYNKMIRRMLTDIDRSVFEKILINFFVNANLASWPTLEENRKKYNCNNSKNRCTHQNTLSCVFNFRNVLVTFCFIGLEQIL